MNIWEARDCNSSRVLLLKLGSHLLYLTHIQLFAALVSEFLLQVIKKVWSPDFLQMTLPHLTSKTLKTYLFMRLTMFPIPISQFSVVLSPSNTAEERVLWCCFCNEREQRWAESQSVLLYSMGVLSKALFIDNSVLYQPRKLFPCSQT